MPFFKRIKSNTTVARPAKELKQPASFDGMTQSGVYTTTQSSVMEIPATSSLRGIRYLALQGGGMKGLGHLGAVEELERYGVLNQIEVVAGSSAGGMAAMLLAVGCSAEELKLEMDALNFEKLQDKRRPGWVELTPLAKAVKRRANRGDLFKNVQENVPKPTPIGRAVAGVERAEDLVRLAFGSDMGVYEGDQLAEALRRIVKRRTGNPDLTFRQLAELAEAKGPPYKKLVVTVSNLTTGELEYWSADDPRFADRPIWEGASNSGRFPGAFVPSVDSDGQVRVDGGLKENLPDVFNKPPYCPPDPMNEHGGNRYAFALGLKPSKEKKKKMKGLPIISLLKDLYKTKMSEEHLIKKYGDQIAMINPVGVGTLEFDASEEKKQKLVKSGGKALRKAFRRVLSKEQNEPRDYDSLPAEELIRILVALSDELKTNPNNDHMQAELIMVNKAVEKAIKRENLNADDLKRLREKADKRLQRQQQFLPRNEKDKIEQLVKACTDAREELERINHLLQDERKRLGLVRLALDEYKSQLIGEFTENAEFRSELQALREKQHEINRLRAQVILGRNSDHQLEFLLASKQSELDIEIHALLQKYDEQGKDHMVVFLEDVLVHLEDPKYVIPKTHIEIEGSLNQDLEECDRIIEELNEEITDQQDRAKKLYQQEITLLEAEKEKRSGTDRYENLMFLKDNLNDAIYRKTSLLTKANRYMHRVHPKAAPFFTPVLQVISHVGFILSAPRKLARIAVHLATREEKSWDEFKQFLGQLGAVDLERDRKLHEFSLLTKQFVEEISANYGQEDKSVVSYLYQLYSFHLQELDISPQDILERREGESKRSYDARMDDLAHRLEALATIQNHRLFPDPKMEGFIDELQREVKRHRYEPPESPAKTQALLLTKSLREDDIRFFDGVNQQIDSGNPPELSKAQIKRYLRIGKKVEEAQQEKLEAFKEVFAKEISEIDKSPSAKTTKKAALTYFRQQKHARKKNSRRKMKGNKTKKSAKKK